LCVYGSAGVIIHDSRQKKRSIIFKRFFFYTRRGLGLRFLLRFLDLTLHQEVPKLFSQQELRGVVDKTTAQQSKVQQFETDRGLKKYFSVNIS
jgi:hypothetical protein